MCSLRLYLVTLSQWPLLSHWAFEVFYAGLFFNKFRLASYFDVTLLLIMGLHCLLCCSDKITELLMHFLNALFRCVRKCQLGSFTGYKLDGECGFILTMTVRASPMSSI